MSINIATPRIVGGYEVSPKFKYSNLVSLQCNGVHVCGGTLYNANTVITAAHCTVWEGSNWTAHLHRHNLWGNDIDEKGWNYTVTKRINHPSYDANKHINDIAIWKLETTNTSRTSLELDDGSLGNGKDTMLTAIGWGRLAENTPSNSRLMETNLPVYDYDKCATSYSAEGYPLDRKAHLCAGYAEGVKGTCSGDSGGPLFAMRGDKQVLAGVTSFGVGCARPNLPSIFARVSSFKDWIIQNSI